MDIKGGFTTSSKEQLRSLVRVHELDEITSNGGKNRSVTKEHPRGLKRKRPDFMHGEPPSWTGGWHRQNGANGGGKVHNHTRTHRSEGATEPSRDGPGPVGPSRPARPSSGVGSAPLSLHPKDLQPYVPRGAAIRKGESHSHREAIHKIEREEGDLRRRITQLEGSTHKWRRRKTPSEASPWSTVPCLAPWWGNLLICPWVVIDLEM
jgi:hypothetical protein